jgi:hypothetical protein
MRKMRNENRVWLESLKGRYHSEDPSTDGRIILKLTVGKQGWRMQTGFTWLRIGAGGRLL